MTDKTYTCSNEPAFASDRRDVSARPYGVVGRVLGHSYTPVIYRELAGLDYRPFELELDELESFLRSDAYEGVNITIPYKKDAAKIVDVLSDNARRLGNINTVTRMPDGRLRGDNTDYFGFKVLIESLSLDLVGKKAVVFGGRGGAGSTAMTVLADLGMDPIAIERTGINTYETLDRHADAALAVNCTPVGMFPNCPASPCSLGAFPDLEGLVDIVYNPARTALMMEAERRGIPSVGGLLMLVAQAAEATRIYKGLEIGMNRILEVTERLSATEQNIAIIGMPGSGKSAVADALANLLGREHVDCDEEFKLETGIEAGSFITTQGEEAFRKLESKALGAVGAPSGRIISCGGGVVETSENYPLLHQNSRIIFLDRELDELVIDGRPISLRDGVETVWARRKESYRAWADQTVRYEQDADTTAQHIIQMLPKML